MLLLACLLYTLIERRLRRAKMAIPSPSRRQLSRPTGHEVVRPLESVQVVTDPDGQRHIALDPLFHPTLDTVLRALDVPETVFTTQPERPIPAAMACDDELDQLPTFGC